MEKVENLSETVANRLIEFSDAVRKRDYAAARRYLTEDFLGTAFAGLRTTSRETLPPGTTRTHLQPDTEHPLDRDAFVDSLDELLAPLEAIEYVFFKTRGAEFEASDESRGLLRMTANIIGRGPRDRPYSLYAWAAAEVTSVRDASGKDFWLLRRFVIERIQVTERETPMFTDVAASAGVADFGPRLGTPENSSFYWRGAATADVDGDGLFDIFTSTSQRNFLYRNRGSGTFEDATETAGLARPAGVTGPLFFDYDRDGDQDLFCGHVGWKIDGVPDGEALHLFRNDGRGRFEDVTVRVGLAGIHMPAFSACAADIDNDGWLDLFVSSYNRLDAVYPNSWYRASNGEPNALFHNQGGKSFRDIARTAGVAGQSWSYAAAFADFDEDGDQDLYVANDYGDNRLYLNRGDLTFQDVAAELGVLDTGNGMGATWGDLDNDGRLDLYVSNMSSSAGNRILKRLGAGASSEGSASRVPPKGTVTVTVPSPLVPPKGTVSSPLVPPKGTVSSPLVPPKGTAATLLKLAAGNTIFRQTEGGFQALPASQGGVGASWAWSAALLDIDLDGIQDVYVANGFISGDSLKDT
jgi:hypothetical protein